jgi:hypothetical protein
VVRPAVTDEHELLGALVEELASLVASGLGESRAQSSGDDDNDTDDVTNGSGTLLLLPSLDHPATDVVDVVEAALVPALAWLGLSEGAVDVRGYRPGEGPGKQGAPCAMARLLFRVDTRPQEKPANAGSSPASLAFE